MKQTLLSILLFSFGFANAQLQVTTTETPEQLIQNTFMGTNATISNVKFNGTLANALSVRDQLGKFSNGNTGLGPDQGLILCTGKAIVAASMNNSTAATNTTAQPVQGDPDLATITTNTVRNVAIVEFDFVANYGNVLFEYIFASEEYSAYANSGFNDVFGLFLSGPGITGPYTNNAVNIALIPGTSVPVTINNLNNGTTNNGPCEYCQFYVHSNSSTPYQFNARTTEFTASGIVTPGQTYHLKFAIANVGDNLLDSAIFLTQGSFRSAVLANDAFTAANVRLFPNPASDKVHISAGTDLAQITVFDLQGRSLMQISANGTDLDLDTASLSTGTYVVELGFANQQKTTQKLVIR